MTIAKKQWLVVGVVAVLALVASISWWYANLKSKEVVHPEGIAFPVNPADTIVDWSFEGAYTGNTDLIAKANADIEHLISLLGRGEYDDYDLYIGIGNDYDLLGNGADSYVNYNRAVSVHPDKGLAYANIGHLMDELGAYRTAADAYAKAVEVEPTVAQYRNSQLDFLAGRFPDEAARVKANQ